MSLEAFSPSGPTVLIAATSSTGQAPTQISTGAGMSFVVRLTAPTSAGAGVPVYVAFGSSSVAAGVPTTTTPTFGVPIQAGVRSAVFTVAPSTANNWISAVTSAGAASLFATPGSAGHN